MDIPPFGCRLGWGMGDGERPVWTVLSVSARGRGLVAIVVQLRAELQTRRVQDVENLPEGLVYGYQLPQIHVHLLGHSKRSRCQAPEKIVDRSVGGLVARIHEPDEVLRCPQSTAQL